MSDFTLERLSPAAYKAKHETRLRALHLVRQSALLWSHQNQCLRYSWLELAGAKAPTLQMLLDHKALSPSGGARFIGVDREPDVIRDCTEHFRHVAPAHHPLWITGELTPLLTNTEALPNTEGGGIGVLVYDSEDAIYGKKTFRTALRDLANFTHTRLDSIGEFLLVINVAIPDPHGPTDKLIADYHHRLRSLFNLHPATAPNCAFYRSSHTLMLWTGILFAL